MEHRNRGQVLILLVGALFLGGGAALTGTLFWTGKSPETMRDDLKSLELSKDRVSTCNAIIERWETSHEEHAASLSDTEQRVEKLLRSADSTRSEIEAICNAENQNIDRAVDSALAYRQELRDALSAEEWRALFSKSENQ